MVLITTHIPTWYGLHTNEVSWPGTDEHRNCLGKRLWERMERTHSYSPKNQTRSTSLQENPCSLVGYWKGHCSQEMAWGGIGEKMDEGLIWQCDIQRPHWRTSHTHLITNLSPTRHDNIIPVEVIRVMKSSIRSMVKDKVGIGGKETIQPPTNSYAVTFPTRTVYQYDTNW